MRGRPGRGQAVAELGPHRRLERDLVVLQAVPRADVAERDVHQTAVARFAATDWKNSITTLRRQLGLLHQVRVAAALDHVQHASAMLSAIQRAPAPSGPGVDRREAILAAGHDERRAPSRCAA